MLAVSSFLNGLTPDPPFLCKPAKIIVLLKKKKNQQQQKKKTQNKKRENKTFKLLQVFT